ncbi:hypothetical protein LEP1GSC035_4354 [Leptospira noguchii str. 2007001578]|uniref:Uncharacterized protein n=1 Tax=Leptospira noguchii str. 2007001578 TaxID=1049974 RepID=A0ABN0IVX4_9LEPT|nr:hypothetical protein LEP1GSC035_4354 [Leptospira noguchii str. 2007001578]
MSNSILIDAKSQRIQFCYKIFINSFKKRWNIAFCEFSLTHYKSSSKRMSYNCEV